MVKSKLGITFDNLVISITILILVYLWSYKFFKLQILSLFLAVGLSIIIFIIIQKHSFKTQRKLKLSSKEQKKFENIIKTLSILTEQENNIYFERLLETNRISKNIYENEKCYFYINFSQKLSSFDYFYANNFYIESPKIKPLIFLSNGITAEFEELLKSSSFDFKLYFSNELFEIIKKKEYYPESTKKQIINKSANRLFRVKNAFKETISKARFREFFFSGLSLIFLSVIVPFSLYYLISGTIFLIISLLCLIIKKDVKPELKNEQNLVDFCEQAQKDI